MADNTWLVELVVDFSCHPIEIEADSIEKIDFQNIKVDGVLWSLPVGLKISFGEITESDEVWNGR